jgi:hypothetical protein
MHSLRELACLLFLLFQLLFSSFSHAQIACTTNEDLVTFNFGAAAATNASGSTVTWLAGSTSNTYGVATAGSLAANTISFSTSLVNATYEVGFPALTTQGGVANSLDLNMNSVAPGSTLRMRMSFNRPMNKVRFNMLDIDRSTAGPFHDTMEVRGFLNGNTSTIPVITPVTPADYTLSDTAAGGRLIDRNLVVNCPNTSPACNARIDMPNPVDAIEVLFIAGTGFASPGNQRVGFNNFSYCVPKRELSLSKVDNTSTFVAGSSGIYNLTLTNRGGTSTNAPVVVHDVLQLPGVTFAATQPLASGFVCVVSTTTYASDTASCTLATSMPPNSTRQLSLIVR